MTTDEKITMLEEAQEKICEAIDLIRTATRGNDGVRRTIIATLEIMVEAGSWVSIDPTIPELIRYLEENTESEEATDARN